jgi:hypothetical protein
MRSSCSYHWSRRSTASPVRSGIPPGCLGRDGGRSSCRRKNMSRPRTRDAMRRVRRTGVRVAGRVVLLVVGIAPVVVALGSTLTVVGLAAAVSRADVATLAAVSTAPSAGTATILAAAARTPTSPKLRPKLTNTGKREATEVAGEAVMREDSQEPPSSPSVSLRHRRTGAARGACSPGSCWRSPPGVRIGSTPMCSLARDHEEPSRLPRS